MANRPTKQRMKLGKIRNLAAERRQAAQDREREKAGRKLNARKCGYPTQAGAPCKKYPSPGLKFCHTHCVIELAAHPGTDLTYHEEALHNGSSGYTDSQILEAGLRAIVGTLREKVQARARSPDATPIDRIAADLTDEQILVYAKDAIVELANGRAPSDSAMTTRFVQDSGASRDCVPRSHSLPATDGEKAGMMVTSNGIRPAEYVVPKGDTPFGVTHNALAVDGPHCTSIGRAVEDAERWFVFGKVSRDDDEWRCGYVHDEEELAKLRQRRSAMRPKIAPHHVYGLDVFQQTSKQTGCIAMEIGV